MSRPIFPKYSHFRTALNRIIEKLQSADHFTIDCGSRNDQRVLGALHLVRLIVQGAATKNIPFEGYPLEIERVIVRAAAEIELSGDFLDWAHSHLRYLEKSKRQGLYRGKRHLLVFLYKVRRGLRQLDSAPKKRG